MCATLLLTAFAFAQHSAVESSIMADLRDLTEGLQTGKVSLESGLKKLDSLLQEADKTYNEDNPEFIKLLQLKYSLALTFGQLGNKGKESSMKSELREKNKQLLLKYPKNADAWFFQGSVDLNAGANELTVLSDYAKCINANSMHTKCKELYKRLRADFERPRCKGFKSDLSIFLADNKKSAKFFNKHIFESESFFSSKEPQITKEDFQEIIQTTSRDFLGERPALLIKFNTIGSGHLSEATKKNVGLRMLLVANQKVVFAPTLQSEISDGRLILSAPRGLDAISLMKSVCMKIETPLLPKELRINK